MGQRSECTARRGGAHHIDSPGAGVGAAVIAPLTVAGTLVPVRTLVPTTNLALVVVVVVLAMAVLGGRPR